MGHPAVVDAPGPRLTADGTPPHPPNAKEPLVSGDPFTPLVIPILLLAISLGLSYLVIRAAVRAALSDHYKTVRWYEKTGEWNPGSHGSGAPRPFEGP